MVAQLRRVDSDPYNGPVLGGTQAPVTGPAAWEPEINLEGRMISLARVSKQYGRQNQERFRTDDAPQNVKTAIFVEEAMA